MNTIDPTFLFASDAAGPTQSWESVPVDTVSAAFSFAQEQVEKTYRVGNDLVVILVDGREVLVEGYFLGDVVDDAVLPSMTAEGDVSSSSTSDAIIQSEMYDLEVKTLGRVDEMFVDAQTGLERATVFGVDEPTEDETTSVFGGVGIGTLALGGAAVVGAVVLLSGDDDDGGNSSPSALERINAGTATEADYRALGMDLVNPYDDSLEFDLDVTQAVVAAAKTAVGADLTADQVWAVVTLIFSNDSENVIVDADDPAGTVRWIPYGQAVAGSDWAIDGTVGTSDYVALHSEWSFAQFAADNVVSIDIGVGTSGTEPSEGTPGTANLWEDHVTITTDFSDLLRRDGQSVELNAVVARYDFGSDGTSLIESRDEFSMTGGTYDFETTNTLLAGGTYSAEDLEIVILDEIPETPERLVLHDDPTELELTQADVLRMFGSLDGESRSVFIDGDSNDIIDLSALPSALIPAPRSVGDDGTSAGTSYMAYTLADPTSQDPANAAQVTILIDADITVETIPAALERINAGTATETDYRTLGMDLVNPYDASLEFDLEVTQAVVAAAKTAVGDDLTADQVWAVVTLIFSNDSENVIVDADDQAGTVLWIPYGQAVAGSDWAIDGTVGTNDYVALHSEWSFAQFAADNVVSIDIGVGTSGTEPSEGTPGTANLWEDHVTITTDFSDLLRRDGQSVELNAVVARYDFGSDGTSLIESRDEFSVTGGTYDFETTNTLLAGGTFSAEDLEIVILDEIPETPERLVLHDDPTELELTQADVLRMFGSLDGESHSVFIDGDANDIIDLSALPAALIPAPQSVGDDGTSAGSSYMAYTLADPTSPNPATAAMVTILIDADITVETGPSAEDMALARINAGTATEADYRALGMDLVNPYDASLEFDLEVTQAVVAAAKTAVGDDLTADQVWAVVTLIFSNDSENVIVDADDPAGTVLWIPYGQAVAGSDWAVDGTVGTNDYVALHSEWSFAQFAADNVVSIDIGVGTSGTEPSEGTPGTANLWEDHVTITTDFSDLLRRDGQSVELNAVVARYDFGSDGTFLIESRDEFSMTGGTYDFETTNTLLAGGTYSAEELEIVILDEIPETPERLVLHDDPTELELTQADVMRMFGSLAGESHSVFIDGDANDIIDLSALPAALIPAPRSVGDDGTSAGSSYMAYTLADPTSQDPANAAMVTILIDADITVETPA